MKKILVTAAFAALSMLAVATPTTNKFTLLTVREDGAIDPRFTNVLATVRQLAQLQADMLIASEKARNAESVYAQTTNDLMQVAEQLVGNNAIIYRRYFIDSFASAMIIDEVHDKVWMYDWQKAPSERQTVSGRTGWDVYYAFHGKTDIRALKGIFKTTVALDGTPTGEWDYLDDAFVADPVPLGQQKTDPDGNVFEYSYRTTVYLPSETTGFLIISIQPQAADADGAVLVMYGGYRNGLNEEVTVGDSRIAFVGGLAVGFYND